MAQLQLQMLFSKTEETQQKTRQIKAMVKEALEKDENYQKALTELETAREKAKQIELAIKQGFVPDLDNLDALNCDLRSDKEIMADLALEKYRNAEPLEVKDKFGNTYLPTFKVSFKKVKKPIETGEIPEKLDF